MPVRPKKAGGVSPSRLLFMLVLSIAGTAVIASVLGFLVGVGQAAGSFNQGQQQFIDGLIVGSGYRRDFEDWKSTDPKTVLDVRADPKTRCAGSFYPALPLSMSGCLTALKDRPSGGYQMPATR